MSSSFLTESRPRWRFSAVFFKRHYCKKRHGRVRMTLASSCHTTKIQNFRKVMTSFFSPETMFGKSRIKSPGTHAGDFRVFYSASHCKRCTSYGSSVRLSVRSSIRLSVCLSVTRRYCTKTTARSTVQFAQLDSKMCLVL